MAFYEQTDNKISLNKHSRTFNNNNYVHKNGDQKTTELHFLKFHERRNTQMASFFNFGETKPVEARKGLNK